MRVRSAPITRRGLRCGSILIGIIVGCHPWSVSSAWAQEGGPRPKSPPIPFFGAGSPLERLFGLRHPAETDELRKVDIPLDEERAYGERILEAARQNWKSRGIELVTRGDNVEYVRTLVGGVKRGMRQRARYPTIRVLVAQSDAIDAYSVPGGTIIVFRGLLDFAESEAALVGILGHELAHLDRGHQLLPLQRSRRLQASSRLSEAPSFDQFLRQASLLMSAWLQPFRPEDEAEADRDGATWTYQAHYDPREMARLFARLNERDQVGRLVPPFLRTHPYHDDRRAAIERLYGELQRGDPRNGLAIGRENLRRRVPVGVRDFDK